LLLINQRNTLKLMLRFRYAIRRNPVILVLAVGTVTGLIAAARDGASTLVIFVAMNGVAVALVVLVSKHRARS
jgi:hypothetical protein